MICAADEGSVIKQRSFNLLNLSFLFIVKYEKQTIRHALLSASCYSKWVFHISLFLCHGCAFIKHFILIIISIYDAEISQTGDLFCLFIYYFFYKEDFSLIINFTYKFFQDCYNFEITVPKIMKK